MTPSPNVVLATVRHSGSHFAFRLLGQAYTRYAMTEIVEEGDKPLWFTHCEPDSVALIREKCRIAPLVLTMRHPMNVAKSWMKRGKPMDRFFRAAWENLFALKEEFEDSYWLPLDTADRDRRLYEISQRLGHTFHTEWKPEGTFYGSASYTEGMTLDEAQAFFRTLGGFKQFGYVI